MGGNFWKIFIGIQNRMGSGPSAAEKEKKEQEKQVQKQAPPKPVEDEGTLKATEVVAFNDDDQNSPLK